MNQKDKKTKEKTLSYLKEYTSMDILGVKIKCPYWSNKIENSKVVIRGFQNGKGEASKIREEIIRLVKENKIASLEKEQLTKIAKRNKVGIDCSGLVYRVLNRLVKFGFLSKRHALSKISDYYKSPIERTSAARLTSPQFTKKINAVSQLRFADLVRMMKGKHILFITDIKNNKIEYVHSSHLTKEKGVHFGQIEIIDPLLGLIKQKWQEKTLRGNSFKDKYFHPKKSDGIYRLKIFD